MSEHHVIALQDAGAPTALLLAALCGSPSFTATISSRPTVIVVVTRDG